MRLDPLVLASLLFLAACPSVPPDDPPVDDDDSAAGDDDDSTTGDDDDSTESAACPEVLRVCEPECRLDIAIDPVRVTGTVQWDGADLPPGSRVRLNFRSAETGEELGVRLESGTSALGSFDVPMMPGTYDVSLQWLDSPPEGSASWPDAIQGQLPVVSGWVVPSSSPLEIDLTPARVVGGLQWDGADIGGSSSNRLEFRFRPSGGGDELLVQRSAFDGALGSFDLPMLPGTYDVSVQWADTADAGNAAWPDPIEGWIPVAREFVVSAGENTLDVDLQPARVTGLVSWDGAPIPASSGNEFELIFRKHETFEQFIVPRSAEDGAVSSYDIPMFPGTYDAFFRWRSVASVDDAAWPDPIHGPIPVGSGVVVSFAGGELDLDIAPVRLTGALSWDGAPIPQDIYNDFDLTLIAPNGERFSAFRDGTDGPVSSYDIPALPGTYEMLFRWTGVIPEGEPSWPDPVWEEVSLGTGIEVTAAGGTFDIDIAPARLTGALSWDGGPIGAGQPNQWQITFRSSISSARHHAVREAALGAVDAYDVPIHAGTWNVGMRWTRTVGAENASWPDPIWGDIPVGALTVPQEGAELDIGLDPVRLSGGLAWDGGAIPGGGGNGWALRFTDPDTGTSVWVDRDAGAGDVDGYTVPVLPGIWDLAFEWTNTAPSGGAAWPDPVLGRIPVASCVWIR